MPTWRGGGRRKLLKIISICRMEGMGVVPNNVFRKGVVFLVLSEQSES
jgi:hypothetical protein